MWDDSNNNEYMHPSYMPSGTRYVNQYNDLDYAFVSTFGWETNQVLKPDAGYSYYTSLSGNFGVFQRNEFSINVSLGFPDDRFEIFSYAAESVSEAIATEGNADGLFQAYPSVDLNTEFGFGGDRDGHSAQFRSYIQERWEYWSRTLDDMGIIYP